MENIDAVFNVIFVGLPLIGMGVAVLVGENDRVLKLVVVPVLIGLGLAVINHFG